MLFVGKWKHLKVNLACCKLLNRRNMHGNSWVLVVYAFPTGEPLEFHYSSYLHVRVGYPHALGVTLSGSALFRPGLSSSITSTI